MNKPVLFAGTRPYGRAENISALYDAYPGEKKILHVYGSNSHHEIRDKKGDVLVIDDFPTDSPGKCIMIWHGIQGGKYIGFDQPSPYLTEERMSVVDYIITPGRGSVWMWEQCCKFPKERILPLGMPRTDAYIGKKKGDGHTFLADKIAYLYVPTFRWSPEPAGFKLDYEWLDKHLTDDEVFVVKAHVAGNRITEKHYNHIVEISQDEPTAPYLYDCDVVITDYSSIIFDGYLLGKPAVLFEKEPGYVDVRGMYMKYPDEYCSNFATNEQDLLYKIRGEAQFPGLGDVERKCMERVADMCDGHSCERIIKLITELNGGE